MTEVRISEKSVSPRARINDYACEKKLQKENSELHETYSNSIVAVQMMLNKYRNNFPNFTDHTILHSIEVIELLNQIIGDNIDKLSCDDIYILLMSAYLHDSGMGISKKDYEEFKPRLNIDSSIADCKDYTTPDLIRIYHHELSGMFIDKYASFFEIPSEDYVFAIKQVSRGHRKTDLLDENEYPVEYVLQNGNKVCLPYLAALLRLADELDIAVDRNLAFLYDLSKIKNPRDLTEFKKHIAIKHVSVGADSFYMEVDASDNEVLRNVMAVMEKLRKTLEECILATRGRTPFDIYQEHIMVIPIGKGEAMV